MLKRCPRLLGISAFLLLGLAPAGAQPDPELRRLQGAWVPEGARCEKVFFRQGTSINFFRPGAATREGILVEGKRIGDARNRCSIKKVRPDGDAQALLITCYSGLVVSNLAFTLRFVDDDTIIRTLSDFPEEEVRLRRCKI